ELLLLRPAIERVIAHWMRNGARQARYFGRLKVWMQCVLSAIMCNVKKIADKTGPDNPNALDFAANKRLYCLSGMLMTMLATVISVVGTYLDSIWPLGLGATYIF